MRVRPGSPLPPAPGPPASWQSGPGNLNRSSYVNPRLRSPGATFRLDGHSKRVIEGSERLGKQDEFEGMEIQDDVLPVACRAPGLRYHSKNAEGSPTQKEFKLYSKSVSLRPALTAKI